MSNVYEDRIPQLLKLSEAIRKCSRAYQSSCDHAGLDRRETSAALCATLGMIVAGNAIKHSVPEEAFVELMRAQYRRMKKRLSQEILQ